jgi:MFS family permease
VRVPEAARPGFLRAVPALVASWALPGLYLSLGPSIAAGVLGSTDHLVAGTLILVLNGVAALAVLVVGERDQRRLIIGGGLVLVAGVVLMLVALATGSTPLLFVATGLAGAGGGPTFLGAFRSGVAAAPADERGALIAALYLVSYLAFSLPAVLAGAAVRSAGLRVTATWYGLAVVVLALLAVAAAVRSGRSAGSVPQESTADVTAPAGSTPSG